VGHPKVRYPTLKNNTKFLADPDKVTAPTPPKQNSKPGLEPLDRLRGYLQLRLVV
jgi:hypothetical protein